jgi:diguanylate cyclase
VALSLFIVADVTNSYQTLHGSYSDGSWLDALWLVALALFAIAAQVQRTTRSAEGDLEPISAPSRISWLPYAAVALGFGTLLYSDRRDGLFPGLTMTLIALALAGLVSVRQLLGQRDLVGAQSKLSFQALHDGLTGLPNRTLLYDRLAQALARRDRDGTQVAVLLLDVDDFKEINDTLLHAAGDELLIELAGRLRAATRQDETVARLGGDEFASSPRETSGKHSWARSPSG